MGRALPPPKFGQNPKEQPLFFGKPSLRRQHNRQGPEWGDPPHQRAMQDKCVCWRSCLQPIKRFQTAKRDVEIVLSIISCSHSSCEANHDCGCCDRNHGNHFQSENCSTSSKEIYSTCVLIDEKHEEAADRQRADWN